MTRTRSLSPKSDGRKRGRIACKPCRQAKVRCNLDKIPCARCTRQGLDCSIDPGFKRTNKHDKVEELENDIEHLKSLVAQQQHSQKSSPPLISGIRNIDDGVSSGDTTSDNKPSSTSDSSGWNASSVTSDQTRKASSAQSSSDFVLGKVKLGIAQVETLFNVYFDKFHPLFPVLSENLPPSDVYTSSTVLFWTMIYVAARSNRGDSDLVPQLMPALTDHLWTQIGSNPRSIVGANAWSMAEIQAMLLLATWPLPNIKLWSDKSLVLSSMALTSAMHIGLHRPGYEFEYVRDHTELTEKLIYERAQTWTSCFCASVSLFTEYGHVPMVPAVDWMINNICARNPNVRVSDELRDNTIIQKCSNESLQRLAQLSENPADVTAQGSFFPLMSLLESNFDYIERESLENMSLLNKIRFRGAQMLLQTMYFLADDTNPERFPGCLRAHNSALSLLQMMISDEGTNDLLIYAPHSVVRVILRAAWIIIRILHSSYGSSVDYDNGRILYNAAAFFIRQMSILPKERDQPLRVAETMRMMWPVLEKDPEFRSHPPTLKFKSRFGASLQYDCLIYCHENVKGRQGVKEPKDRSAMSCAMQSPSGSQNDQITTANLYGAAQYTGNPMTQPSDWMQVPIDIFDPTLNLDLNDFSWMEGFDYSAVPNSFPS